MDKDNPRAQALYERHGLVVTDTTGGENRLRWNPARGNAASSGAE